MHGILFRPTRQLLSSARFVLGRRGGFGACALLLVMLLRVAPAGAAALTFVEVQSDGGGGSITGLGDVSGVAVSPDGNSVYTAGSSDNAIGVFARSASTGRLVFTQAVTQGDQSAGGTDVTGLDTPVRVTVGPLGQAVYAVSVHGALAVFDRDPAGGILAFRDALTATPLGQARAIAVSPDGEDLYVAGDDTSSSGTGILVHIKAGSATVPPAVAGSPVKEGSNGVAGLARVADLVVSPDGRYLYASSEGDNALAVFERDADSGALTFQGDQSGIGGLQSPGQMALSADGQYLYVAAGGADGVTVFQRDAATGGLTFVQTLTEGDRDVFGSTVAGLGGAYALVLSPDGSQLYAAGETGNTLAVLNRDPLSGRLTFDDVLANNQNGVDGLDAVLDLAVSPDGQSLYTAASVPGKVGVFASAAADLNLVMKADAQIANAGQHLQYSLIVTNKGGAPASGTIVYDRLPANLTFVSADASQGSCGQGTGPVLCHLNTLASGATATVNISASVGGTAKFTDSARVAAEERDPNPGDNIDSLTLSVNHPPVANPDSARTNAGTAVTIDVLSNDTDPDNDTLSISGFDLRSANGGTVSKAGGSKLIYTPKPNFYGQDSFHYTVSDGRGASATGTVTVLVNGLPKAVNDNATVEPGAAVNIDVLKNDSDPDGDTLSIAAFDSESAHGGTIAKTGAGTLTYTAASGFSGLDTFHYTVSDGRASATATVTVVVNTPPVAVDDKVVTERDTPVTIPVLANDHDPDGNTITVTAVGNPSKDGATVVINDDGTVTYSPPKDATGTDTFTYTITDSLGAQATATVSVLINTQPIALDDSAGTTTDTPITIYVLANDHDPDGDPFHITKVESPTKAGGSVAINNGSTVTYTPPKGFVGPDNFTYTIADSHGATSSATVSVTVQAGTSRAQSSGSGGVGTSSGVGGGTGNSGAGGGGALGLPFLVVLAVLCLMTRRRIREC